MIDLSQLCPSTQAVAAGLMLPDDGGEPKFTDAGLFAIAGMIAHDDDVDGKASAHCFRSFCRILRIARAGGLTPEDENYIRHFFAEGINPFGDDLASKCLQEFCKMVALYVIIASGSGRMGHLLAGDPVH